MELLIVIGITLFLALFSYGYYEWINKIELERKYLQGLLAEKEKDKNIIRKSM
jgi:hypothetical protein